MADDFTITGLKELRAAMEHLTDRYKEAIAAAVYQEACAAMLASLKLVPVDSGRLRQSHYVAPPQDLDDPTSQAGYGAAYGVYVHERTDLKHNSPTKDHFLSDPLAEAMMGYSERLAKRVQSNLNQGIDRGNAGGAFPKAPRE